MSELPQTLCSECGGVIKSQLIEREFEREGVRVVVSGVRALVCQECGAIYFPPGGAQALVEAANSLFALARRNHQHKGKITARQTRPRRRVAA